jgi:NADPH:quinone reductase
MTLAPVADHAFRAAVLAAPGRAEILRGPLPSPGAGQVRVQLEGCGFCASNLGPWEGVPGIGYPMPPGAPGHEGWGRVDKLGDGVTGVDIGQRVAVLGSHSFATHEIVGSDSVVALPPALDGTPFPGEALACVMNIFRRSGIAAGQRVVVVGAGFMGLLLTQLAAQAGASVMAVSRRAPMRDMARRMGAADVADTIDPTEVLHRVRGATGGTLADVVIEAGGAQFTLDLAADLVADGGRLVVAGYHQDGPRRVNMQQWNWRGIDVINAHERDPRTYRRGLDEAIAAMAAGRLDPLPLYTHSFALDDIAAAFDAAREKPDGFVKALVTC